ncbi:MAG TPA: hypothetical protein VM432_02790 [Bdellovibrionales bacterium]|nr:hypothetical protein [Bdellovibrionales bacterium]
MYIRPTSIFLFLVFAFFGARVFASPSLPALATSEFLKLANDDASVTGQILEGIRKSRATKYTAQAIPKPLQTTDLQVVELSYESYPGLLQDDATFKFLHEPYTRAQYLVVVTAARHAYDGMLVYRQAIKFGCKLEIKPFSDGTKVSCDPRPLEAVE